MLVKTQPFKKIKIILQHPIRYPPSSHNAIVDTGATKYFVIPNTPFINKNRTIITLRVQIPNGTVLKSTHEGNL